ncbi:MAG TPA: Ppx/GppA phosphatase family protein [Candidatus Nanopelagicales bacterium]|nr:Ppx/GppA phosphatase family protein [Candidatus Nanopelagicales bacterium]
MTRVAAIDCGTNAIRLLVADVADGALVDLDRRMEIVRLGEGVDATGRLSDGALERTFAACERYAVVVRDLGAARVRFVATSASRDAANRDAFVAGVLARIGVEPEVITGDEEAALSFTGATRGLVGGEPPYLVVDIGGGSTEFVLGTSTPVAARSVDVGCVRMTERHVRHDPPSRDEVDAIVQDVDTAISRAAEAVPLDQARTLVGLAGSVTTAAALALGLPAYDSSIIHGSHISAADVARVSDELLALDHDARGALGPMHPGRVDVISAGVLVLRRVLERTGLPEVLVSEHDILDGIAWALAENPA